LRPDGKVSINDSHASAHAELAHYYRVASDYAAAHEQGSIARALDPNSAEAQNVMAFIFLCLNQPKEALTAAPNAMRMSPGAPEFYLIATADAQMMLQRFDEALPLLARIWDGGRDG
jgi:Tfp pilus assembly protein PilF